jgi:hypothetical protein
MVYSRKVVRLNIAVTAFIVIAFALSGIAWSQTDQSPSISRGVRVIDSPTLSHGQGDQSQGLKPPGLETAPSPVAPALSPAGPSLTPPVVSTANNPNDGSRPATDLQSLLSGVKIPNTAGLSMQILPGPEVSPGSPISFKVSSKQGGYLILLDVNASGKLVQVYPNPMSLLVPGNARANSNLLRSGMVLQLPDRANPYSGFEFIASPPSGAAMVIALLSDQPVQMVDLPDVPDSLLGRASAVDYLTKLANELRIPNVGKNQLEEPHWSFDVKFYSIR